MWDVESGIRWRVCDRVRADAVRQGQEEDALRGAQRALHSAPRRVRRNNETTTMY